MTARLWYLAVGAVLGAFACSSTPAVIQNAALDADVNAYTLGSQDCITASVNLAGYRNCVALVRARWCGPGGTLQVANGCGDAGAEAGMALSPAILRLYGASDAGATPTAATGAAAVGATPDAGGQ